MPHLQRVKVDVGLTSPLRWELTGDAQTLWVLSLGSFDPHDEMHLQALLLGLDQFLLRVWEPYGGAGIVLYQGALTLADEVLAALEILGAVLPAVPILELDAAGLTEEAFYFLRMRGSLRRFEVRVQGGYPLDEHAPLGLLLPEQGRWGDLLATVPRPFRVIPEKRLTEAWEGLDTLVILPEFLTPSGRRMVQGFRAAGGEVINFPDDADKLLLLETSLRASLPASPQIGR